MRTDRLIGSVISFDMGEFHCYAHCTHKSRKYGYLLRFFKPKFALPISGLDELDACGFRMCAYFPLKTALKAPDVCLVGKLEVSLANREVPPMRQMGLFAPREIAEGWWIVMSECPREWWLIESEDESWVTSLSEEQTHYSTCGIYNIAAIKEYFRSDLYPNSRELLRNGPVDALSSHKH